MSEPTTADSAKVETVYQVKSFVDAAQMKQDIAYSDNDLDTATMEQASLFAHYGTLAADASHQVDVVKLLLENTEAAVYQLERTKAAEAAEKVTEVMLEKRVARHSRVISMKKALIEAKRVEATGKIVVEAFRQRRDMLVQTGATSREERKGELRIMERNAREDAMKERGGSVMSTLNNHRAGR